MKRTLFINFSLTFLVMFFIIQSNVFAFVNQDNHESPKVFPKKSWIGLVATPTLNIPSNSTIKNDWQTQNAMGFSTAINFLYVKKKFGIGAGLQLGNYSFGYDISGFSKQIDKKYTDIDNEEYHPVYENVNIIERTTLKTIDIPIFVEYNKGFAKASFFVNGGVTVSISRGMHYTMDGTLTRKGYYPSFNVTLGELGDIPEYNFYIDKSFDGQEKIKLNPRTLALSAFFSAGIQYEVNENIQCRASLLGQYGFSDVTPNLPATYNEFYSSQYSGKTALNTLGIQFGLFYRLSNRKN